MNIWDILETEPTEDKRAVKRAYARKIKTIDAAANPKDFQDVREAYEKALWQIQYSQFENDYQDVVDDSDEEVISVVRNDEIDVSTKEEFAGTLASTSDNAQATSIDDANSDPFEQHASVIHSEAENHSETTIHSENIIHSENAESPAMIADRIVKKMDNAFLDRASLTAESIIEFLYADDFQDLEVSDILRFRLFEFFIDILQRENNLKKVDPKVSPISGQILRSIIKEYDNFFDWSNSELELSNYFGLEQMNLVFGRDEESMQTPTDGIDYENGGKSLLFWILLIFIIVKFITIYQENFSTKNNHSKVEKLEYLVDKKPCLQLRKHPNELTAIKCKASLLEHDDVNRFALADYWLKYYEKHKDSERKVVLKLNQAIELLEVGKKRKHLPSIQLLTAVYTSPFYDIQDLSKVVELLKLSAGLGDSKSKLLLAITYYFGEWTIQDTHRASLLFDEVALSEQSLTDKQSYVLAVASMKKMISKKSANKQQYPSELLMNNKSSIPLSYINEVSWFLATTENEHFDPELALNLAIEFDEEHRDVSEWMFLDTLAAAYAANGNFDKAVTTTFKVMSLIEEDKTLENNKKQKSDINSNLTMYLSKDFKQFDSSVKDLDSIFKFYLQEIMNVQN